MTSISRFLLELWRDERGEMTIEYGLLVAVVAFALIAVFTLFSGELISFYDRITGRVDKCIRTGAHAKVCR